MKILIASDLHGRLKRVQRLEEIINKEKPDYIFLLGDYMYNGPRNGVPDDYDPMAVCEILNSHGEKIIGCMGNCDALIDMKLLKFMALEPIVYMEAINNRDMVMLHGDEASLSQLRDDDKYEIYFSGHTHVYKIYEDEKGLHVNPGSISFPKEGQRPSYCIWNDDGFKIYDLETEEVLLDYFYPIVTNAKGVA